MPTRSLSKPRRARKKITVARPHRGAPQPIHPWAHVWAALTVAAFPISMFAAVRAGVAAIPAFFWGMVGTAAIVLVHVVVEGRVWMLDPRWRRAFDDPEFSLRLAVVSGALLFLVESAALVYFFTEPGFDRTVLTIVFTRECERPTDALFQQVCQTIVKQP